jgi:hypothetical protein
MIYQNANPHVTFAELDALLADHAALGKIVETLQLAMEYANEVGDGCYELTKTDADAILAALAEWKDVNEARRKKKS